MTRLSLAIVAAAALAGPALAADDPILARQLLMRAQGASAGAAAGMMKQEIPYSPVVANAALRTLLATGATVGDYFPEGSFDPARSRAAEAIWSDPAGFAEELAEFRGLAEQTVEAAGRDGPADLAAFQGMIGPVLQACQSCHETYRLSN